LAGNVHVIDLVTSEDLSVIDQERGVFHKTFVLK
jgi:hypothetical protein